MGGLGSLEEVGGVSRSELERPPSVCPTAPHPPGTAKEENRWCPPRARHTPGTAPCAPVLTAAGELVLSFSSLGG